MSSQLFLSALLLALQLLTPTIASTTTTICSPQACINTSSSFSSPLRLGASFTTSDRSYLLLPGTYSQHLPSDFQTNSSSASPLTGLSPFTNYSLSNSANAFSILPTRQGASFFSDAYWLGTSETYEQALTTNNVTLSAQSLVLSPKSWLKVRVAGGEDQVIWTSLADLNDAPLGINPKTEIQVVDVQSSACSTPCSSGGTCVSNDIYGSNGTCVCSSGFTGEACETCAEGQWGPNCLDCASHCDSGACSDGLEGNGQCTATVLANSTSTCNCLNGQCATASSSSSPSTCTCSSGWASPNITSNHPTFASSSNHLQCSICASGFILSEGECVSCGPYATACSSVGVATACVEGYGVELGRCVASNGPSGKGSSCSGSNYWDSSKSSCSPCSPTCGEKCYGSSSSQCLNCASGKGLLGGTCVDVDSSKGTCDQISAGFKKTQGFWFNGDLDSCDTCPAKSTACTVSDNASNSTTTHVKATACIDGYLLSASGVCESSCPAGEFRDGNSAVCHVCLGGCATCEGYSSYCTSCSSGLFAMDGSCVSACDADTFAGNGTCTSCHGDCSTCSGTGFDQCLSCPWDRPVLSSGRCLPVCSFSQYFDSDSGTCKFCDTSCGSCTGSSSSQCLTCAASDQVATSGTCKASECSTSFIPFLSTCLDTFVSKATVSTNSKRTAIHVFTILFPLLIILGILCAWLFIRHERERTQKASQRYKDGMDDIQVRKSNWAAFGSSGVEGVLGFMGRTKEDVGRRWKERADVKRVKSMQSGLRPLKLAGGRSIKDSRRGSEYEMAEDDKRPTKDCLRTGSRKQHPPPYTPSATDDVGFCIKDDSDQSTDEEREDDYKTRRPLSRYTITTLPPSPPYETAQHDRRANLSVPALLIPPLAACPRPYHLRSQTSVAPSTANTSSRRTFDLEDEPFPDFQQEYSTSRQHAAALLSTLNTHSRSSSSIQPSSRFLEGDASDISDSSSPISAHSPFGNLVDLDSPSSLGSPPVIRGHYWLANPMSEGGRSEEEVRFGPSPVVSGSAAVGQNNPFRGAYI